MWCDMTSVTCHHKKCRGDIAMSRWWSDKDTTHDTTHDMSSTFPAKLYTEFCFRDDEFDEKLKDTLISDLKTSLVKFVPLWPLPFRASLWQTRSVTRGNVTWFLTSAFHRQRWNDGSLRVNTTNGMSPHRSVLDEIGKKQLRTWACTHNLLSAMV